MNLELQYINFWVKFASSSYLSSRFPSNPASLHVSWASSYVFTPSRLARKQIWSLLFGRVNTLFSSHLPIMRNTKKYCKELFLSVESLALNTYTLSKRFQFIRTRRDCLRFHSIFSDISIFRIRRTCIHISFDTAVSYIIRAVEVSFSATSNAKGSICATTMTLWSLVFIQ